MNDAQLFAPGKGNMIKGIFFDAGGILYQRQSPTAEFAAGLLRQNHILSEMSSQEENDLEVLRVQASQGQVSHDAYWQQYLLVHGVLDPVQRLDMIKKITDYSNSVQPVSGGREVLAELKERRFILGIVTDTIYPLEWKMNRLVEAGVAEFIDVIACSSDLGVHKPDPAIYLDALRHAGLNAAQSAFVGHDPKELIGAHQAGMLTIAVNYSEGVQADHYCSSLYDLLTLSEFEHAEQRSDQ